MPFGGTAVAANTALAAYLEGISVEQSKILNLSAMATKPRHA